MNEASQPRAIQSSGQDVGGFVLLHLDEPRSGARLYPGASLAGKGWVIADSDVTVISLHLGNQLICFATYGLPSPDVAERFPHYPHADHAGFSFSTRLSPNVDIPADASLMLRVRTATGREATRFLPFHVADTASVSPDDAPLLPRSLSELWPIRIMLESARLDGAGLLRLSGWIVSLTPLLDVALFLNDEPLAQPEMELERPDVAANHPSYPNAGVSGFRLVQDVGALKGGQAGVIRVQARCDGGIRRQIMMPVDMPVVQRTVLMQDSAIHLCVDSFSLRADGSVAVQGWAVSAPGIGSITVSLDGAAIGDADLGRSRADVGNRFPRISSARQSGFRFAHTLPEPLGGEHLLTLQVRNADGEMRVVQLPLHAETPDETDAPGETFDEIRFDIDNPALLGDRAAEPVRGLLTIGGWAVAKDGIAAIEVSLDDVAVGTAHIGIRREDIGALFPDIPSALLAGYAFTLPKRLIGEHALRVTLRSNSGRIAERAFHITGETPEESTIGLTIRRRLPQAEADFGLALLDRLGRRPTCQVIVRVKKLGGKAMALLSATLESLRLQAYPAWRAVVLLPPGDRPADPFAADPAFAGRVTLHPATGAELGALFDTVDGETLLTVLTAGDRLGADALLRLATEAVRHPGATLVYADERRYDASLDAVQPQFKPDWSPDLMLSSNYIGRAWCATAAATGAVGVTQKNISSGRDYDLVLRLTEAASTIRHLPALLLEQGTRRIETPASERQALQAALRRRRLAATVVPGAASGTWRVRRGVNSSGVVSIIIPTCAAGGLIETAIRTLRTCTPDFAIEIVCIDSIPPDQPEWKAWLRVHADVVVETAAAFNWSLYNNLGVAAAKGDFLLFLNDDIEVLEEGWLEALLEHAQRPEVGLVGPQLTYPDGRVQHAGMFLAGSVGRHAFRFAPPDDPGPFGLALSQRNVIAVTGACMLMRREVYDALGGFDEAHSVVNNDLDFCLRVGSHGLAVIYTPYTRLIHHELASRAAIRDIYDVDRFRGDWAARFLKGDPFYNPALLTDSDDYAPQTEPIEVLHVGRPLIARDAVKSIMVVKLDHIGDFVMAFPALRRLKQRFPGARLHVLGARASGLLAALEPVIDEFIEFNFFNARSGITGTLVDEADLAALEARLRPYRFDIAIDLRMQGETRHVLRRTGAVVLAGFEHAGRFPWLDVAVEWEGDRGLTAKRVHAGDHLLQLVETLAVACESGPPAIPAQADAAADRQRLLALLAAARPDVVPPEALLDRPLVCVHPGVGSDMKQWPAASFAALIDLLVAGHGARVVLIGVGEEAAVAEAVAARVAAPEAIISLLGTVPLGQLPIVLRACRLYVGNDSGPKHLAAALGVPTLGIHSSNVDPGEWAPMGPAAVAIRRRVICGPCYIASPSDCHRDLFCLRSITPGDAYRACEPLLSAGVATIGN